MDRELALVVLVGGLLGATGLLGAFAPPARPSADARATEASALRHLLAPLLPASAAIIALVSWAVAEPDAVEDLSPWLAAPAVPFGLLLARALVRTAWRIRRRAPDGPAMTIGLVRPRIHIAPALAALLDGPALAAAMAHELVHVRSRDPLRVVLAELATDLLWPWPAARVRLVAWREALELACDDDARRDGVDGADLAAAILAAARLVRGAKAAVALTDATSLELRVRRLLEPVPARDPVRRFVRIARVACIATLVAAAVAGAMCGEDRDAPAATTPPVSA